MGAFSGMGEEDFFEPYTLEVRNSHVKKVNEYDFPAIFSE